MLIVRDDYERVALGGLLHDIGKLLSRCNRYTKEVKNGKHPTLSEWFIYFLDEKRIIKFDEDLKEIVKKHHDNAYFPSELVVSSIKNNDRLKSLATIVAQADNYSSMERHTEDGDGHYKTRQLDSIFSKINIGNEDLAEESKIYRLNRLETAHIFSETKSKNTQEEFEKLIEEFLNEVEQIKTENFTIFYNKMLEVMKKYLWCLASDTTKRICDLSLYDHSKTTSAIAVASYNYHVEKQNLNEREIKKGKDKEHFLLIGGDISGIQKYIYSLKKSEGLAKRLRGRSFFIKLLSQVASYKIIDELNLTQRNIVISNSGKFYIVSQNTEKTVKKLEKLRDSINDELYVNYEAELFLNLQWIELKGEELGLEFNKKYERLNQILQKSKGKKFEKQILKEPILYNPMYGMKEKVDLCPICNRYLKKKTQEVCEKCDSDERIGGILPKLKRVVIYKNKIDYELSLFGYQIRFLKEEEQIENEPYLVIDYKGDLKGEYPVITDYYGGFTPLKDEKIMTFSDIARESKSNNLGVLKGDVDNLGIIINLGLKIEEESEEGIIYKDVTSISRVATLSRMLDMFFSYWLPEQLKNRQRELGSHYIIYSGGDDFMIVGAWDKLLELSKIINDKFYEYVGENKNFTISMGLAIVKSSDPIYYSAKLANELENLVKESGKNGLAVFDRYIPWSKYNEVFKLGNRLCEFIERKELSQSFIYRLLNYTEMAEKSLDNKENLIYASKFEYDITRNVIEKLDDKNRAKEIWNLLSGYFGYESVVKSEFLSKYMRVVLNYSVRKLREVRDV